MAWAKVTHTGTPGNGADGLGTHIRATLVGDAGFTTNWTVGAEKLFGAGATERSYFTLTHANGLEVLVYVANGADADGGTGIHSTWRNPSFASTTDQTIWIAINPDGGAGGFEDELNVQLTDPAADAGFWDAPEKSEAVRLVEWLEGSGSTDLHFVYDTVNANLVIISNGNLAARVNTISVIALGEDFVDGTSRPAADRLPRADGMLAVQSDDDAGGNECEEYELYVFPGGGAEYQLYSEGNSVDTRWRLVDAGAGAEPDADGNYLSQSIVVQFANEPIRGIINFDMVRHIVDLGASTINGKERKLGEFMCGPRNLAFRWDGSGDIVP